MIPTLLLLGIVLCIQSIGIAAAKAYFPDAVCYRSDTSVVIGFDDLQESYFSLAAIQTASVDPPGGEAICAEAYYTDASFGRRASVRMVCGSWFATERTLGANRSVVISEDLAVRLFFTKEAVGGSLTVDGRTYTVCGVYAVERSLWHSLARSDTEIVFFPYTAHASWRELPCNLLLVDPAVLPFTNAGPSVLQELTGKPLLYESVTSYPDLLALYHFLQRLVLFCSALLAIGFLLYGSFLFAKRGMRLYRKNRDAAKKPILLAGIGVLTAVGLWLAAIFEPKIPASLLPPENIFDFAHYGALWLESRAAFNGQCFHDAWWALSIAVGETVVLTAVTALFLLLLLLIRGIWHIRREEKREYT